MEQPTETETLPAPAELKRALPLAADAVEHVATARREIERVLEGRDRRLVCLVGPCSIHDPASALEYATRLATVRARLADELVIGMRVYVEKPRTALGWKGFLNDPALDGSCDLARGLRLSRELLGELARIGMPAATETLDPVVPQYLGDLVAWTAIGARTTESQTHRELASGLEMPVGFKNGMDGNVEVAINALRAVRAPHARFGIGGDGRLGVVRTRGHRHAHLVLRGGRTPNYAEVEIERTARELRSAGLEPRVLVDCSHGNSGKNPDNQGPVALELARQLERGSPHLLGVMLESHLVRGRQELVPGRALVYGQSITDACLDFATTERLLEALARAQQKRARVTPPHASAAAE